jgi:hypothetical protein
MLLKVWILRLMSRHIGAVGMFPRLAFVTLSNNLMILSLRSMMGEFISMQLHIIAFLEKVTDT